MADTAYFPERYGRSTVPAIIDILDGNEVQNPIFTPAAAITPANVLEIYPQTPSCTRRRRTASHERLVRQTRR